ncbi:MULTISPECIES: transcriptional regulator [Pectobacterium]|uniref:winged helix-turn-helix domain-containing protein n=1 Tax=Pectobacterium TaxID=122277 RepID=UPI0012FD6E11|nr:transcriptional regulator [Pectobacterium brasiliense]MBA0210491.1 transcriptional regulator [Pectobacterium brasiliense]MCA6982382.1 transcriptional regulator [Pectobacterium brasiliense]MCH4991942.1 transcriptional regulator [Pectobacterium brasiliense]
MEPYKMWQLKKYDDVIFTLDNGVRFMPGKRCVISESGIVASLSENSYRFLVLLVTGETDKQEIISQVWYEQRGLVTDSSYYGQIYILRKALELVGLSGDLIKTVPRKGVIFLGKAVQEGSLDEYLVEHPLPDEMTVVSPVRSKIFSLENHNASPKKNKLSEWCNSPVWNKIISILAILSVCWLTTLTIVFYSYLP